jgi:hypothetical protein
MRRREFIMLLGGMVLWPLPAIAQQSGIPIIGFLTTRSRNETADNIADFRKGLSEPPRVRGLLPAVARAARTPRQPGRSSSAIVSRLHLPARGDGMVAGALGAWYVRLGDGWYNTGQGPRRCDCGIRSREREGAIELPPKVRPGDRVRVLRGPFRDHIAIYAGMTGRDRVAVLLRLLGGERRILLPRCDIDR